MPLIELQFVLDAKSNSRQMTGLDHQGFPFSDFKLL
jgi:hypothetical protein